MSNDGHYWDAPRFGTFQTNKAKAMERERKRVLAESFKPKTLKHVKKKYKITSPSFFSKYYDTLKEAEKSFDELVTYHSDHQEIILEQIEPDGDELTIVNLIEVVAKDGD